MRRYLVVANQTLGSDDLVAAIRERLNAGPSEFYILVPATHSANYIADMRITEMPEGRGLAILPRTDEEGLKQAHRRLAQALKRLRATGATVDGEVGDPDPIIAIRKILKQETIDEIVISTLPRRFSTWLHMDLPHRIRRRFKLPVTHVENARQAADVRKAASGPA